MRKKFDLIFSIGEACSCTQALRDAHLQYYSYPFDWLYGAPLSDRANILISGFKDWLNKEALVKVGDNDVSKIPKYIYENKETNITFNHDFEKTVPFDEMYERVNDKYNRRIKRLLTQIDKSKQVLCVFVQTPNNLEEIPDNELVNVHKILSEKFGNKMHLLYLKNENGVTLKNKKFKNITDKIRKVYFEYDAHNKECPYTVNAHTLYRFFKRINISTKNLTFNNVMDRLKFKLKLTQ